MKDYQPIILRLQMNCCLNLKYERKTPMDFELKSCFPLLPSKGIGKGH